MKITRIMNEGMFRLTATFLAGFFFTLSVLPSALAASTLAASAPSEPTELDAESLLGKKGALRTDLTRSLGDERVRAEMAKAGVQRAEVESRIAGMTDAELQQLKDGVQREAGGDTVIIGTTTLLLIIIIIILVADHSPSSAAGTPAA